MKYVTIYIVSDLIYSTNANKSFFKDADFFAQTAYQFAGDPAKNKVCFSLADARKSSNQKGGIAAIFEVEIPSSLIKNKTVALDQITGLMINKMLIDPLSSLKISNNCIENPDFECSNNQVVPPPRKLFPFPMRN